MTNDWRELLRRIPGYDPFRDAAGYAFDEREALRRFRFFRECITHVKGSMAGKPYILEPHEECIVANLFGWKNADGYRRYREALYLVARKNSKSTLAAGLVLCVLYCDNEPMAEVFSTASSRDQARIVFDIAKAMIRNCPQLSEHAKIYTNAIVIGTCSYKPASAEAGTNHGHDVHASFNDEIHAHRTPEFLEVMQTGTGARRQPIQFNFTTQDYQRPHSVCLQKYDYACKVRDGVIRDPAFLPIIYEVPQKVLKENPNAWKEESAWHLANPNLGKSVSVEYLDRECKRAMESPGYANTFKRLHCNIITEQMTLWIELDNWNACHDGEDAKAWRARMLTELQGASCFAALDLGSTGDLTALSLVFPKDSGYIVLPWFWVPRATAITKSAKYRVPYLEWAQEEYLIMTDGNTTDYDFVEKEIERLNNLYPFVQGDKAGPEIAIDRLFQGAQTSTHLMQSGFDVIAFGQGFLSMAAPTKRFEELILDGLLYHGDNPVLKWMASNVCVKTDAAGNIKPNKPEHSEPAKIDGIVTTIMAIGRAMAHGEQEKCVYEDSGIFTF